MFLARYNWLSYDIIVAYIAVGHPFVPYFIVRLANGRGPKGHVSSNSGW